MKYFMKAIKINWLHKRLWLVILFSLLLITSVSLLFKGTSEQVSKVAMAYEETFNEEIIYEDFQENLWKKIGERQEKFREEGIGKDDLNNMKRKGLERARNATIIFSFDDQFLEEYNLMKSQVRNWNIEINGSNLLLEASNDFFIFILFFLLGLTLVSFEQLTPFYKFNQSMVWDKSMDYIAKFVIGSIVCFLFVFLTFTLGYLHLLNSPLKEVLNFSQFPRYLIYSFLRSFSNFSIVFSLGQLTGSFLGQIILSILGFGGVSLWGRGIGTLFSMFFENKNVNASFYVTEFKPYRGLSNIYLDKYYEWLLNKPIMLEGVLTPYHGMVKGGEDLILGSFLLSIILLLLTYFWSDRHRIEKVGYIILNPKLSNIIMWLSIFGTSIFFLILIFGYYAHFFPNWLLVISFLFLLFISYKFYKTIFSIRIGL